MSEIVQKNAIKVCSLRDPQNIVEVCQMLHPRYVGFDFRATSPRYIGEIDQALLSVVPADVCKVGIFGQESALYISYVAGRFSLGAVQIEGDVSAQTLELLTAEGLEVIKVLDTLEHTERYEGVCNKFLIRDAGVLAGYCGKTPLIMDCKLQHADTEGVVVDIMDDFEDRMAYKNCEKIENWRQNRL